MTMHSSEVPTKPFVPWNKGKVTGQKPPLKPREVWAIRVRVQVANRVRDLALFNLAIDSKLRGCDLVKIKIDDLVSGARIRQRAVVIQQKTGRPVPFELLEPARTSLLQWLERRVAHSMSTSFPAALTG